MTTITKPDLVLRVALAGQCELPEAARDGLARRLDAVYGVLGTAFVAARRGRVRHTLVGVLPFDAATYRDRSPVEDKRSFDTLLADCEHVIELDGRYLPDPPPGALPDDFPSAPAPAPIGPRRRCSCASATCSSPSPIRRTLPLGTDAVTLIGSREALEPEPDLTLRTATPD